MDSTLVKCGTTKTSERWTVEYLQPRIDHFIGRRIHRIVYHRSLLRHDARTTLAHLYEACGAVDFLGVPQVQPQSPGKQSRGLQAWSSTCAGQHAPIFSDAESQERHCRV